MTHSLKDSPFIRVIPDYPKPGIQFYDITPLLGDALAFHHHVQMMALDHYVGEEGQRYTVDEDKVDCDYVAGVEARGFIIGAAMAYKLGVGFIPVRKKGKLPYTTLDMDYETEYGPDALEIHTDATLTGERVLVVDDVLATGGTVEAAVKLFQSIGSDIVGVAVLIELRGLGGRERLEAMGVQVNSHEKFEMNT